MEEEHSVHVELKKLPSYSDLNKKVRALVKASSWWERYGLQWLHILAGVGAAGIGLLLLREGGVSSTLFGLIVLGIFNTILTISASHMATHNALGFSKSWNKFWRVFFVEFLGSYSEQMGTDNHIRMHHPHTNIIGLGDSSSYKAPGLPGMVYLLPAPLFLPLIVIT